MDSSTNPHPSTNFEGHGHSYLGELMTTNSGNNPQPTDTLVSDTVAFYFQILIYISLSACVSIFGIVTNIINIIVFVRQGIFKDGGSPSLLGLAVSDLCCVISMLWLSISFALVVADPPGLSWNPWDITYIAAGRPHFMCAQITRMVTAFVAFERCICVVFPFRVRTLFTPLRSIMIITGIFCCCGFSYFPAFVAEQLKWRVDPNTNTTRLVVVSDPNWLPVLNITFFINSTLFSIGSVVIVFLCTMITVSRVKLSKAWRQSMVSGSSSMPEVKQTPGPQPSENADNEIIGSKQEVKTHSKQASKSKLQKEKKLIRMIVFISLVFLICYLPDLTFLVMNAVDHEIRVSGKYGNLAMVMYSFISLMETVNSSINILIYYTMSSKYKEEFRVLFALK